jgi:hypothetical protein
LNAIKRSLIDGIGIGVGIVERVRGEWGVGVWELKNGDFGKKQIKMRCGDK